MTVEEIRGSVVSDNAVDKFPIGMRVLAVDDNPTCLKVLDSLLRKCQYHVTTTNEAAKALKMLRENRNRFDLIISDVYMPDMDGFKLLELVGLEMDLPVIMLSGNSDPKLVMKGITHGACDYLVKPVRLEELRNIWQHVVRRKVETKSKSKSNNKERLDQGNDGGDQIVKVNRKRRDEDDDDENDDSDDPSSNQKRPRVVWSIDLHKKFVAAVNQLGVEKAVPKRILDLMNVDGLTRENVASHLQKYRLYLRRISQHANMIVAFGGGNDASSYTRMSVLDVIGDFRTVSNSGRLPNSVYAGSGMLGRLNSTSGLTLHSLAAKPFVQPNHTQNQLQASTSSQPPNHQNVNRLLGIPSSFDLDNQQYGNKPNAQLTDFGSTKESQIFSGTKLADFTSFDESRMLTGSRTFADPSAVLATQSSLKLPSANSEPFNLLSGSRTFADPKAVLATQSSLKPPSTHSEPFNLFSDSRTFADPSAVLSTQSSLKPPSTHSEPFNLLSDSRTFANPSAVLSTQSSLKPPSTHSEPFNLFSGSRTFADPSAVLESQSSLKLPSTDSESFNLLSGSRTFADPSAVLASQSSLNLPYTDSEPFNLLSGNRTFADPNAVPPSQSSLKLPSTDSESFNLFSDGSCFLDQDCHKSGSFSSNQLTFGESYSYTATGTGDFGSNITTTPTVPLEANGGSGFVSDIVPNVNQSLPNQYQQSQNCGNLDYSQYSHNAFSSSPDSGLVGVGGVLSGLMNHTRSNDGASTLNQIQSPSMHSTEDYLDQTKLQDGFFASNGYGSFDDIMTGMKKQDQDPTSIMAGDFGYDHYSFGSCK